MQYRMQVQGRSRSWSIEQAGLRVEKPSSVPRKTKQREGSGLIQRNLRINSGEEEE